MPSSPADRRHVPGLLVGIVLVYVILAAWYNITVPVFEAPDEPFHFFYVKHLADGNPLPVQDPDRPALWAQEGSQPPLYYFLAAQVVRWIDTSDARLLLWRNPHANLGNPLQAGNKNVFIHLPGERWPLRGAALAVHLARALSTLLGVGTICLTFLLSRSLLPGRHTIAYGAAALVAFTPQFIFVHSAVSNDSAVIFLSTLALWLLVRILHGQDGKADLALGIVLGLAALSKLSGLMLWPLAALVILTRVRQPRSWPRVLRDLVLIFGVAVLVSGWWYVRNWQLYGEPTGLSVMLQIVGPREPPPTLAQLGREFEGLRISFWATFGWFSILAPTWIYDVLDAVSLIALAGLIWGLWRHVGPPVPREAWLITLLMAWLGLLLVGLVRWTSLTPGTQGRLMFPAISSIMILLALGWCQWVPRRWRPYWMGGLVTGLGLFAAICPPLVIAPAYRPPSFIAPEEVPQAARLEPVIHGDRIQVVGATLEQDTVRAGEMLWMTVYWQALQPVPREYSVFVHVLSPSGRVLGEFNTWPGLGTLPTQLLRPGQVLPDRYPVPIAVDLTAPSLGRVEVGLYDLFTHEGLPTSNAAGQKVDNIVGTVRILPASGMPSGDPPNATNYVLEGQIALDGYELSATRVRAGEALDLDLYWRALRPIIGEYTVFTHLEDDRAQVIAQHDKPPLDGDWPTWAWEPGEPVVDSYHIAIPPDARPGRYALRIGMYRLSDGSRLSVQPIDPSVLDNAVQLAIIEVLPGPSQR